ncbi:hypothetical protein LTR84_005905 [Exophiala bonariae]|uniref:DUF7580 domain-containing protein n=1 Tax=Exophiala bonariae TaxID=1690606 RepID=A0AAV9N2B5_9EURO|nr:hypothetical protein LTR84_005905 [Exophiala bonariae]
MELAAFVIGTSSLISVAEVCLTLARAIDGVKAFKEESASLYAAYNFEQVRLTLWIHHVVGIAHSPIEIDRLKIDDGDLPPVLTSESPINLHQPLQSALTEVAKILKKLNHLLGKYGANEVSVTRRIRFQTGIFKQGGKDEIRELLAQLKNWNDSLDRVLESRMRQHLISNMHIRLLSAAQTDRELEVIQGAAQGTHESLRQEAAFRRQILSIANRSDGIPSGLKISSHNISPSLPPAMKNGAFRYMGKFDHPGVRPIRVLQEWKLGQPNWGDNERTTATTRADRLASMLRIEHKPPKLRCLDLAAYTITDGPQNRLDFCFLYHPPPFANGAILPLTLHTALTTLSERKRPTLAQRFGIAATLAESLLAFHTANWLHKAVCSTNVLFFADAQNELPNFRQPFMAGFEFSRPDTVRDLTLEGPASSSGFDAYCHPELVASLTGNGERRRRYQRRFDIYGLGVVLLEIGCWMTVATILRSRQGMEGTTHDHLLETVKMSLPSRVGSRYKQAVWECLHWEEDESGNEPGSQSGFQHEDETEELRAQRQRQRETQIEDFANTVVAVLRDCHCTL